MLRNKFKKILDKITNEGRMIKLPGQRHFLLHNCSTPTEFLQAARPYAERPPSNDAKKKLINLTLTD